MLHKSVSQLCRLPNSCQTAGPNGQTCSQTAGPNGLTCCQTAGPNGLTCCQTAGPNGLTFFEGIHGFPGNNKGFFSKIDFLNRNFFFQKNRNLKEIIYKNFMGNAGHIILVFVYIIYYYSYIFPHHFLF